MKRSVTAFAVAAAVSAAGAALPSPAEAKPCRDVRVAGQLYVVGGSDNLSCRFMRKWTRRYQSTGAKPRGWRCRNSSSTSGGCNERRGRKRFFVFYPPHR